MLIFLKGFLGRDFKPERVLVLVLVTDFSPIIFVKLWKAVLEGKSPLVLTALPNFIIIFLNTLATPRIEGPPSFLVRFFSGSLGSGELG